MDEHAAQGRDRGSSLFRGYGPLPGTFDEFWDENGRTRPGLQGLVRALEALGEALLRERQQLASSIFLNAGITFSVYSDNQGAERIFPFDLIPRAVEEERWRSLELGLKQRVAALNAFLGDIYTKQRIVKDGRIPEGLVRGSPGFVGAMRDVRPRAGVYVHIAGIDLIREPGGDFVVLEDNVRTPSGVSYVLENRSILKRTLPSLFRHIPVRSVDDYPARLRAKLVELSPVAPEDTRLVVLTPGPYNSAYFEHSFLARRMGCELVLGSDLFVHRQRVYVKTTAGPERVHVIYRRVDDDFLDPHCFRPDSLLGVPGLVESYVAGQVTLANAIGNGVADDKAIYPFVPEMIRFYLAEEPLLRQVPTYICSKDDDRRYVLENLPSLVVKAVDASGGRDMLIGPSAPRAQILEFGERIRNNPRGYIAQPRIELSTAPTFCDGAVEPRRVDLRPYVVTGESSWVLPGGLTRVALVRGSYVVNSSQGGGSKDTWVLAPTGEGGAA